MKNKIHLLFAVLLVTSMANAQNIVPNGGFETYTSLPTLYGQSNLATGWNNVNGVYGSSTATPDYFHTLSFTGPAFGTILPNSGNGQMGIWSYLNGNDSREYVSIQLNSTLVVGQEYQLTFYLTNGIYGMYTASSDNFGVHFSASPLTQVNYETILVTPQVEIPGQVFHSNYWQQYTFTFIADNPSNHITFGNFETNANTTYSGGNSVYYFIDDVELITALPSIQIQGDTSICIGDSTTLTAVGDTIIGWVDSSNPSVTISTDSSLIVAPSVTTTYIVYGSNDTNSVTVNVYNYPSINLGNDTTLCEGESIILDANTPNATYLWQDSSVNSTLNVTQQDIYSVEVTVNNCSSSDTIMVNYNPLPIVNLGADTTLCEEDTLVLDVTTPNATYLWQDNSNNPSYNVTQQGTYWAELTVDNCIASDTILVNFNPLPLVDLGADTALCEDESLILNATSPNSTYLWQDNSTSSTLNVSEQGTYWVEVTANNCSASDSILVNFNEYPLFDLGADTLICQKDGLILNAGLPNATYLWQDSSTVSEFKITEPGVYWVEVTVNNCTSYDDIEIQVEVCESILEIPNVFTPNGDGVNDYFVPVKSVEITSMKTVILNRWGNVVFETDDPLINWDGQNVNDGTYFWIIEYVDLKGGENKIHGFVNVVK